ncbi:MAG: redoxin family protein [Planctomycetales bacterium]|nr:redoxin family protein [Planctomycetales bacterium]
MISQRHRTAKSWNTLTLILLFCGCSAPTGSNSATSVVDLNGKAVNLFEENENNAFVVVFMRTDCPIGNRYAPTISQLAAEFRSSDLEFVLVYPIVSDSVESIKTHLSDYSLDLKSYRDPHRSLVKKIGASVTPEAAVFDRQHRLIYRGRVNDRFVDFGKARLEPTTDDLRNVLLKIRQGKEVEPIFTSAVGCYIEEEVERKSLQLPPRLNTEQSRETLR